MTRERLEAYRSNKEEIQELAYKLIHLREDMIDNSVILDGRTGIPRPQAVIGVDEDLLQKKRRRYQERKEALEKECEDIETYIENITDSLTRRIFRMYYIDGIPQQKVARKVHMSQSAVSRRIDKFFEEN
ncbi:DUF1492 domain-containing protein [Lachnospiraceae bacterium Marseille-Q4251]|nr:DUF1492 domain-containing protein [Lachnospiraceae bacterium Marseille-Q4251]